MSVKQNIWIVIPAAGVGRRMESDTPKQYLMLTNKTVIEHTIQVFDTNDSVSEIVIALSRNDTYWPELKLNTTKPLHIIDGGNERCHSVMNALAFLKDKANPDDWILVHDAARPCLRAEDLNLLLTTLARHDTGGILALPVRDTMKRSVKDIKFENQYLISETVDRENLWHALTPQMFRFALLYNAIESALLQNILITDEASAVELAGYQPVLVEGNADNIKITRPDDLALAEFLLAQQEMNK